MGIVEGNRICCMYCLYWYGCPVIAKNETSFGSNSCYCKLFEPKYKPSLNDKLKDNNWIIPDIIHIK